MQRDDNILEEDNVLLSEWYSESWNNGGQDVQKLSSTVELVSLVNQGVEALVDCLSDHLSSGHQLYVNALAFSQKSLYEMVNYIGSFAASDQVAKSNYSKIRDFGQILLPIISEVLLIKDDLL